MLSNSVSIKRPAGLEYIHECLDVLIEYSRSQGFATPDIHNIRLIAEEVLINIVSYAYETDAGDTEISCRTGPDHYGGGQLLIEFRNSGVPFAFERPEPDFTTDLAERPIGGLGIFLIKTLADNALYRREDGRTGRIY